MGQLTEKGRMVKDYCSQYMDMKDLTLAKKMISENPRMFKDVEQARNMIRMQRGHKGDESRSRVKDKNLITPLTYDTTASKPEEIQTSANVLILDIETAPISAFVWGIWNQNIATNQIQSDWFCLTWAAKWLFEKKIYSGRITPKEVKSQDDARIIHGIWELLNKADIVIAHNAEKFDLPKLNSRFIINGMPPPLPFQTIDTLKHIRRQFGFTSNKLGYVNKLLNLERKSDTGGFELWQKCLQGDVAALKKMEEYNVNDVIILEDTYLHIRSWIKPHPNMGIFILDENQFRCPSCGSDKLVEEGKRYVTSVNAFVAFRCSNCRSTGRKRVSDINIKQKRFLLIPMAK